MSKKKLFGLKAGLGAALLAGAIQASPVIMTPVSTNTGNLSWQDINQVSYSLADANGNNQIDVGETVTFTVDMHKQWWGTHDFDALKVWIDGSPLNPPSSTLFSQNFIWDYDPTNAHYAPGAWTPYSAKPWTDGNKQFSFDYTFTSVGVFYLTASVICSADLSRLTPWGAFDQPTGSDWAAWTENIHAQKPWLQGEDERYRLVVNAPPVPEPGTLALFGIGILGMAGFARSRKRKA